MRANFGLAFAVAFVLVLLGEARIVGQDVDLLPVTDDDRPNSILNAPDPSDHTGLLGKIYLQQRYVYLGISDKQVRQLDKSAQGFDTFLNLPAVTLDLPTPLDFDVFFGYGDLGLKGSTQTGPPLDLLVGLNSKSEDFVVGTSIYPTLAESFRPFVQVGAQFSRTEADLFIGTDPLNMAGFNAVDHSSRLLLNVGFEADILDYLGYRMALHLETKNRFQDSIMTNDLILWPHDNIYLRGGMATSLDGGGIGFTVGGGLAF